MSPRYTEPRGLRSISIPKSPYGQSSMKRACTWLRVPTSRTSRFAFVGVYVYMSLHSKLYTALWGAISCRTQVQASPPPVMNRAILSPARMAALLLLSDFVKSMFCLLLSFFLTDCNTITFHDRLPVTCHHQWQWVSSARPPVWRFRLIFFICKSNRIVR